MFKKFIILWLLFIFVAVTPVYSVSPAISVTVMGGGSSDTCDTSNVDVWWRAEATDFSGTNGTLDYASVDDTMTAFSLSVSTGAAKYGTNGLDVADAWSYGYFTPLATLDDEGRTGFWLRIINHGVGAGVFRVTASGADNTFHLALAASNELTFAWKDSGSTRTALTTTSANLSTSTWYYIELAWKTSTNYREIFVDGVSEGSSSATIGSFASAAILQYWGDFLGAVVDYHVDNVIISTDSTVDLFTVCKDETEWLE